MNQMKRGIMNDYTGFSTERSAWEYCNPLMILQAIYIFKLFKQFNFQSSIVNELAKAAFTAYLSMNVFIGKLHVEKIVTGNPIVMLIHLFVSAVCLYMVFWVLYKVYDKITTPIFEICSSKIPILKKSIF